MNFFSPCFAFCDWFRVSIHPHDGTEFCGVVTKLSYFDTLDTHAFR
jgi:hypothetical protein